MPHDTPTCLADRVVVHPASIHTVGVSEGITPDEARRFYDRFGRAQDLQFFEDPALALLLERGAFDRAEAVFELGCGTGRFATRAFAVLPPHARYVGQDVSDTMVRLSRERLSEHGARAEIRHHGELRLPDPDGAFDRFVATYVLDLLPDEDIDAVLAEAGRVLCPGGLLCVAALTHGERGVARWLSATWGRIASWRPAWVGGCRPIHVGSRLGSGWQLEHHERLSVMAVTSEVLVARRLA